MGRRPHIVTKRPKSRSASQVFVKAIPPRVEFTRSLNKRQAANGSMLGGTLCPTLPIASGPALFMGMVIEYTADDFATILLMTATGTVGHGNEIAFRVSAATTRTVSTYAAISAPVSSASPSGGVGWLSFSTKVNATDTVLLERMRIAASGGVSIGTTTDPGGSNLLVAGTLAVTGAVTLTNKVTTYNNIATVQNGVPSEYALGLTHRTNTQHFSDYVLQRSHTRSGFVPNQRVL
jgi:hypothetical protein